MVNISLFGISKSFICNSWLQWFFALLDVGLAALSPSAWMTWRKPLIPARNVAFNWENTNRSIKWLHVDMQDNQRAWTPDQTDKHVTLNFSFLETKMTIPIILFDYRNKPHFLATLYMK